MFILHQSNQLDLLKSLIAEIMAKQPLENVFESELILVQSQGMSQWLQIELANQLGIAANIKYPFPNQFVWDLYHKIYPNMPKENTFSVDYMVWIIFYLLQNSIDKAEFSAIKRYIFNDNNLIKDKNLKNNDTIKQNKYFQLAYHIANLFDQYLVYRPNWIKKWEQNELVEGLEDDQKWQAALWCEVIDYSKTHLNHKTHRLDVHQAVIRLLNENKLTQKQLSKLPKRLFIFGIISLPPAYLDLFTALSLHIDIHLMFMNPCQYYWGDISTYSSIYKNIAHQDMAQTMLSQTNPLLASWSKLGKDYLSLLQNINKQEIDAFVDYSEPSLLNFIKQAILENKGISFDGANLLKINSNEHKKELSPSDNSISLHACHSELREVEILYDHLLNILDNHHDISLNDCVVMMPNIEKYAPFIRAVFDNAPAHRALPYTISDQSFKHLDPVINGFLSLLKLPQSLLELDYVFNLLEIEPIAQKFNLNADDISLLQIWTVDCGIRFGTGDDQTKPHSWKTGIERMLLGFMMSSEFDTWNGILPYEHTVGLEAEIVGHLADFIDKLIKWKNILSQPMQAKVWQTLCQSLINDFFILSKESLPFLDRIDEHWQTALDKAITVNYESNITIEIIAQLVSLSFENNAITHRFLGGKINFCGMIPMRSVPFKVVCLLGMNDGTYPRATSPLGFDLLSKHPQIGDRNKRHDDRYLFLEALLSAEQFFYISYIGFNIKNNETKYASTLVLELFDNIKQNFVLQKDIQKTAHESEQSLLAHLTQKHHRTAFSIKNFMPETTKLISYADEWCPIINDVTYNAPFISNLPEITTTLVKIDELKQFYQHSIQFFAKKRLGLSIIESQSLLPKTELFNLDGLQKYKVNNDILKFMLKYDKSLISHEKLYQRLLKSNKLPYGGFGELDFNNQKKAIDDFYALLKENISGDEKSQEIKMDLSEVKLIGDLNHLYNNQIIHFRCANFKIKDALSLWIDHLIHNTEHDQISTTYWLNKTLSFKPLSKDEAIYYLNDLIEGYKKGINAPMFMPLESSYAIVEKSNKQELSQAALMHVFNQKWQGNSFMNIAGENDTYYQRFYPELDDELVMTALNHGNKFLLPMQQNQQE